MRFRRPDADLEEALTREDIARLRGAAAVSVTPGMEGLARMAAAPKREPIRSTDVLPGKRGRRAPAVAVPVELEAPRKRGRRT